MRKKMYLLAGGPGGGDSTADALRAALRESGREHPAVAYIGTANGDSRTAPMPSEISASSTTSADIAKVTPIRRRAAAPSAIAKLSTLIHRPVAGMTHSQKSYSQ